MCRSLCFVLVPANLCVLCVHCSLTPLKWLAQIPMICSRPLLPPLTLLLVGLVERRPLLPVMAIDQVDLHRAYSRWMVKCSYTYPPLPVSARGKKQRASSGKKQGGRLGMFGVLHVAFVFAFALKLNNKNENEKHEAPLCTVTVQKPP